MGDTKIEMKVDEEIKPLKELCEKMVKMVCSEVEKNAENIDTHELYEVADIIKDLAEAKKYTVEACYKKYIMGAMEKHEDEYGETWDEDGAYDEDGRRFYRGQPRSKTSGRFMSRGDGRRSYDEPMYKMNARMYREHPADYWRDMDRDRGMMYYPDTMYTDMRGYSDGGNMSSRSGGNSSRMYQSAYNATVPMTGNVTNGNMQDGSKRSVLRRYTDSKELHPNQNEGDNTMRMKSLEDDMKELSKELTEGIQNMSASEKNVLKAKLQTMAQKIG